MPSVKLSPRDTRLFHRSSTTSPSPNATSPALSGSGSACRGPALVLPGWLPLPAWLGLASAPVSARACPAAALVLAPPCPGCLLRLRLPFAGDWLACTTNRWLRHRRLRHRRFCLLSVTILLPLVRGKLEGYRVALQADRGDSSCLVATFSRVRSGLPLPSVSVGVALVTVGVLAGLAMSTGVVTVPGPSDAAPVEPEVAQIGGDQPPMEFTPVPSAVRVAPSGRPSGRPVVTSPPHSNPVVTPEVEREEPRVSVVGTTVVPSVSLPSLSSSAVSGSPSSSVVVEP
ncbi:hypothetical protein C8D87_11271 [Lentzea atacamensis]|uniref:Uncharacterized protein n=1 Tax=Lentzea atacamensis TaxID=531938 RepID=A0ABX9DX98_9PSEU|nr:hypothetical protein C8D87_11271 [Lentzea atacamensis]